MPSLAEALARDPWVGFSIGAATADTYDEVVAGDCYRFRACTAEADVGVVVDLGAHIGRFAWWASHRARLVVAVEMEPSLLDTLRRNASLRSNLRVVPAAVCGAARPEQFRQLAPGGWNNWTVTPDQSPAWRDHPGPMQPLAVPARTLREILDEACPGERVAFLKLDIEGAEWPVLGQAACDGALRLVDRIALEWHHPVDPAVAVPEPHAADLVRLLGDADFHVEVQPTCFAGGYLWARRREVAWTGVAR